MGSYLRDEISLEQLEEIVAMRSLFFLKEPDPWAMVIPSLHGEAKAGLLDLLLDEYGWGRYDHMHSTVYEELMRALGLETGYDAYLDRTAAVPADVRLHLPRRGGLAPLDGQLHRRVETVEPGRR